MPSFLQSYLLLERLTSFSSCWWLELCKLSLSLQLFHSLEHITLVLALIMPEEPEIKGTAHVVEKGKGSGLPPQKYGELKVWVCFNLLYKFYHFFPCSFLCRLFHSACLWVPTSTASVTANQDDYTSGFTFSTLDPDFKNFLNFNSGIGVLSVVSGCGFCTRRHVFLTIFKVNML